MRAQFVLNEDYNSLKELHKVSFEIFSWFKEKNIKRLNPLKEDSDEFDIRNIVDFPIVISHCFAVSPIWTGC